MNDTDVNLNDFFDHIDVGYTSKFFILKLDSVLYLDQSDNAQVVDIELNNFYDN